MWGLLIGARKRRESETDKQPLESTAVMDAMAGEGEADEPSFFDAKRLLQTFVVVLLLVIGIYVLLPNVVGLEDSIERLGQANAIWVVVALIFGVLMFFSYVALFRGIAGERIRLNWQESYEITMAGLAATRLFAAVSRSPSPWRSP